MLVALAGCYKTVTTGSLNNGVVLAYPNTTVYNSATSGVNFFNNAVLTFSLADVSDTLLVSANIPVAQANDLAVTIGTDQSAYTAFTKTDTSGINYTFMPSAYYSIVNTTATIPAGQTQVLFKVVFYPSLFSDSSYLLPVSITDASGMAINKTISTVYFHIVGNPLGGAYTWNYNRWNGDDTTGAPVSGSFAAGKASFAPDNPTTVEMQSGYGAQNGFNCRYVLSFTNTGGTLGNFQVALNSTDVTNSLGANGITVVSNPVILLADPVAKHFIFFFQVNNGTADRSFTDEYYR